MRVGAAKRDITPNVPLPYLAHNPRHQLFKGVTDRMYLRAVVMDNVCIISVDSIGFAANVLGEGDFDEILKAIILQKTEIKDVMFASSHIHSMPETINFRSFINAKGAKEWLYFVIESACEAINEARAKMIPSKVYFTNETVPGHTQNRRRGKYLDDTLSVMNFKSLAGENLATIVHFTCHPVVMQVTPEICTDYVGVIEETVERETGAPALFLQGACGDIDPLNHRGLKEDYIFMGNALVNAVVKLLENIPVLDKPNVSFKEEILFLPSRELPEYSEIEEQQCRIAEGDSAYRAFLQVIKIGKITLVGIPGEVFCEMGLKFKEINPNVLTVGYANGYIGYIVPRHEWEKGGYEPALGMWSKVSAEAYDIILENIIGKAIVPVDV